MELNIKTASIAAACLCAATKDIRNYLNGVYIKSEMGMVTVQSTDGAIAFEDCWNDQESPELAVIIPLAIAKDIGKVKTLHVTITGPDEAGRYTCGGRVFKPVDGRFPDMARVMVERNSANDELKADYDFNQLAILQKALNVATGRKNARYRIQNAPLNNAGLVYRENDKYPRAIIMPLLDKAFQAN